MERLATLIRCCGSYSRLRVVKLLQQRSIATSSTLMYKWEPDDLKLEPDIPEYPAVNVKLKGFDFPVLECFSKYVHRLALNMDIDCDNWPVPPKKLEVQTLKFNSNTVTDKCHLNVYERVIQLQNLQSTQLPVFLEMIRNNTPQGVQVELKEHSEEDDEYIYVPDFEKLKLKEALEELDEM